MSSTPDPVFLRRFINQHGGARPIADSDWYGLVAAIVGSCALIALTPPTRGWKLVRASILPLMMSYQAYFFLFPLEHDWETHWGNTTGHLWHLEKALELLLLYPAEEYWYRLRPAPVMAELGNSADKEGEGKKGDMVAEPVPPPRTRAKLYWVLGAWFSQRGIGWNYTAPLPASSRRHPFTRQSGRIAFLLNRLRYLTAGYLCYDLARAYMTFGPGAAFFRGIPGIAPSHETLTIPQRALYSVPIALRVFWSIEEWYTPISIIAVALGGVLGWEGEWWSPWGWPPLFGTIRDLWIHPGLGHMWSKTWHQYFHHWLILFGWIGIGENILGLPASGISVRPRLAASSFQSAPPSETSSPSTRSASPSHPLPTAPTTSKRRTSTKIMLSNFLKSLIVFALTGLHHDIPSYFLQLHTAPAGEPITLAQTFSTTTFFLLQPLALAAEAFVKRNWRSWKDRAHPEWAKGEKEPKWLVTVERTIGFVWTWWWLGHTARYFVVGLTKAGMYRHKPGQREKFSPVGGFIYGQWWY